MLVLMPFLLTVLFCNQIHVICFLRFIFSLLQKMLIKVLLISIVAVVNITVLRESTLQQFIEKRQTEREE